MIYAIQGNNVRWFLSPDESKHLFSLFDLSQVTAEILISGNWNEGLIFKPVVYRSHRGINTVRGSYTVTTIDGPDNIPIMTILVPIEALKLARYTTVNTLKASANVVCKQANNTRELHVYPMQIVDETVIKTEPEVLREPAKQEEPTRRLLTLSNAQDVVEERKIQEQVFTTSDDIVGKSTQLIAAINKILSDNPDITGNINEDGTVKFVRKVVKRRTII